MYPLQFFHLSLLGSTAAKGATLAMLVYMLSDSFLLSDLKEGLNIAYTVPTKTVTACRRLEEIRVAMENS